MSLPTLRDRVPYPLLCALLGLGLGWLPMLVHGPIPEKFNVLYIRGSIAIWAFYAARLSIGLLVGVSVWPRPWARISGTTCSLNRRVSLRPRRAQARSKSGITPTK